MMLEPIQSALLFIAAVALPFAVLVVIGVYVLRWFVTRRAAEIDVGEPTPLS
ncbi:MAG: hypothetical protein ACQEWM_12510 [Actinomycetota bacterium]